MRVHRMLGILSILLSRETITAKELAERFDVSIRTIYRDIDAIDETGIPIYTAPGTGGGIGIVAEYKLNKTVLSDDEMKYLVAGISAMKTIADTEKLQILLSKLATSDSYVTGDSDILIDFTSWNSQTTAELKKTIQEIRNAILGETYLELDYLSSKGVGKKKIAPFKIVFKSSGWYIYGKDICHSDYRFYKITRIVAMENTKDNFIPEKVDVPKDWSDDFLETKGAKVTLSFNQTVEYRIIDIFGAKGYYKEKDNSITVTFNCSNKEWLIHFLLGFGEQVKIIEPSSFKKEFNMYLKKIIKNNDC